MPTASVPYKVTARHGAPPEQHGWWWNAGEPEWTAYFAGLRPGTYDAGDHAFAPGPGARGPYPTAGAALAARTAWLEAQEPDALPPISEPATQTAARVRLYLRRFFPGVRFSVTSKRYAGGSSVRVSYADGPALSAVEAVAKAFESAAFDGMQDLKTHHGYAWEDGRRYYGADYVFVDRTVAPELEEEYARLDAEHFGVAWDPVAYYNGTLRPAGAEYRFFSYRARRALRDADLTPPRPADWAARAYRLNP